MYGTDDGEVSPIERGDRTDTKSLSKGNYGRIDGPQGKVVIPGYELRYPDPIACEHWFGKEVSRGQVSEESSLRFPAQARLDEIDDFGNHELRDEQRTRMRLQKPQTRFVIVVILVDVRVQRSGINDQRDRRASRRMISSMRRAVSCRPLRPAFAASRCRRRAPPR